MQRHWIAFLLSVVLGHGAAATTIIEAPQLAKIFVNHGVSGTFVFYDIETDTMTVWDKARAEKRFVPASTFKLRTR